MATIRKRNASYQIRVSCGYDINGRQIVHQKSWKPEKAMTIKQEQKEVQRIAVLFEEQCSRGQFVDASMKFAAFADMWLKEYAEKQLRATTIFNYTNMLVQINECIGHIRLDRIQPHHLISCYDKLQTNGRQKGNTFKCDIDFSAFLKEKALSKSEFSRKAGVSQQVISSICAGRSVAEISAQKVAQTIGQEIDSLFSPARSVNSSLSGKTVLNYHRLISSILETAVKWQIIISNPCSRVQPPKAEHKEARYLDDIEAMTILEKLELEPLKYRTLFTLLLYSGMRRGEICGLTWEDVNLDNGIIDINKSSLYLPGKGVFDDKTKNVSSTRSIKIPSCVLSLLVDWKREQTFDMFRQGSAWIGERTEARKIFTQTNGKPIHPCSVTDWFEKFIIRYNLPSACVHSLRHTNATLMIASGVDLRTVSKRLGHAQMSTTANIYTHAIRTADELASETIENILRPTSSRRMA